MSVHHHPLNGPRPSEEKKPICYLTCIHPYENTPENCKAIWSLFVHYASFGAIAAELKNRRERPNNIEPPTFMNPPAGWLVECTLSYQVILVLEEEAAWRWERFKEVGFWFF